MYSTLCDGHRCKKCQGSAHLEGTKGGPLHHWPLGQASAHSARQSADWRTPVSCPQQRPEAPRAIAVATAACKPRVCIRTSKRARPEDLKRSPWGVVCGRADGQKNPHPKNQSANRRTRTIYRTTHRTRTIYRTRAVHQCLVASHAAAHQRTDGHRVACRSRRPGVESSCQPALGSAGTQSRQSAETQTAACDAHDDHYDSPALPHEHYGVRPQRRSRQRRVDTQPQH